MRDTRHHSRWAVWPLRKHLARQRLLVTVICILFFTTTISPGLPIAPAEASTGEPAWPVFRHDSWHTGRSPYTGPLQPALKWSMALANRDFIVNDSAVVGTDGTVYVTTTDGHLYAVDPNGNGGNGSIKWFRSTPGQNSDLAIGPDGTVYLEDAVLYALDPLNGTEKWSINDGGGLTVGPDGTIFLGDGLGLRARNSADGSLKWTYTLPAGWSFSDYPAVGLSPGVVYIGIQNINAAPPYAKLVAIDSSNGQVMWEFNPTKEDSPMLPKFLSSPALGDAIYVGSEDNKLYAIRGDGTQKWIYPTGGAVSSSPAIGTDGTIYAGGMDGRLYAVRPELGDKWTPFPTGDYIATSPAIGGDDTVYVTSSDGKLYAINPADGTKKWDFTIGTGAGVTPIGSPVIGPDGTIYVPAGRYLYAITEAALPSDTTPPGVPGNLTAEAAGASQINLSWTASTDDVGVVGYAVYRSTAYTGPFNHVLTVTDSVYGTVYAQDAGLSPATTYYYQVQAFDAAGNLSAPSNTASATTAQAGNVSISGTVRGESGGGPMVPLPGARVFLNGPVVAQDVTNESGNYVFNDLPQGTYTLRVEPPPGEELIYLPRWFDNIGSGGFPVTQDVDLARADLAGVVVDPFGALAGDSHVEIFFAANGAPGDFTGRSAVTDQVYGRFQFDLSLPSPLQAGDYFLRAEPPPGREDLASSEFIPFTWPPQAARPILFDGQQGRPLLQLQAVTVSGVVYQPDGTTPAGQVGVMVFDAGQPQGSTPVESVGTDQDGRFRLALGFGSYNLVASAPPERGWDSSDPVSVQLTEQNPVASGLVLVLRNPLPPSVTGQVVTPGTSDPVEGASAMLFDSWPLSGPAQPVAASPPSDASGNFAIPAILGPDGIYHLLVQPPEGSLYLWTHLEVQVTVGTTNSVGTVALLAPSFVGRVKNGAGVPVKEAWVQVIGQDGRPLDGNLYTSAPSDSDGRFKIGPLSSGVYTLEIIPPPGQQYGTLRGIGPFTYQGSTIDVGIRVLPAPNVTGRVITPDGQPVAQASVQIHSKDWLINGWAQTGADGTFYLSMPAGTYQLDVQVPPGSNYAGPVGVSVVIAAEGLSSLGDIALVQPQVWGRVTDPAGDPVAWAWVVAHNDNWSVQAGGPSDENGDYKIGGLLAGTYTVEVFPPPGIRYGAAKTTVVIDQSGQADPVPPVDLQFMQPNVTGVVQTPGGQAVQGANVFLHTTDWSGAYFTPPTGPDGTFSIGAPDGDYLLEVNPPPAMPGQANILAAPPPINVTISGGAVTAVNPGDVWNGTSFTIKLVAPSKTVSGTVRLNGTGLPGAVVEAFRWNGPGHAEATTDDQGDYQLALTGGEWGVMVRPDWNSTADWIYDGMPRKVTFAQDSQPEQKTIDFDVISAGSMVTGRILNPDGTQWSGGGGPGGLFVEVRSQTGRGNGAPVNSDGTFSVQVPAGSYMVMVHAPPEATFGSPDPVPVTVGENATVDVGGLQLKARDATISGRVVNANGGTPVQGMNVVAFQPMGGGFPMATTDADGSYQLKVSAGTWEVAPWDEQGNYVYNQPPTRLKVAAGADRELNFIVVAAGATIEGTVVDSSDQVLTDLFGFAVAQPEEGMGGFGGPLEGGRFTLKVPAGTYTVGGGLPPGSGYTLSGVSNVEVSNGGTVKVKLVAVANDATISGQIRDTEGNALTGVDMRIFAIEQEGAIQEAFNERGNYQLTVSAGTWRIGFEVDPATGYVSQPPSDSRITVASGENRTYDITLNRADATIGGTVTRPGGAGAEPANGAWVAVRKQVSQGQRPLGLGTMVQPDGTFSVAVPAGTYEVGAFLPPKEGLVNPPMQQVAVQAGGTAEVDLAFRAADAAVSGTVTESVYGAGVEATVFAWSDEGGYMETEADENGNYTLKLVEGESWHVGAFYEDENGHYRAAEVDVTPPQTGVDLEVSMVAAIPDTVQVTFDAGSMKVINLSNGVRIEIPAGALATSGNVTVIAKPVAGLRKQRDANPLGIGYDLLALDSRSQPITRTFYKKVTITVPYEETDLAAAGLSEDDLVPAYWSEDTGRWEPLASMVVDTQANTVSWTVDHFTQFAIVGGTQGAQSAPEAPTGLTATAVSSSRIDLSWNAVSGATEYKVYRSTSSGGTYTQINTSAVTGTSYSDTGLSPSTTYWYKVKASNAAGDSDFSSEASATTQAAAVSGGGGGGPAAPAEPGIKNATLTTEAKVITSGDGELTIDIPAGAVAQGGTLNAAVLSDAQVAALKIPERYTLGSKIYDISLGAALAKPVSLTFRYSGIGADRNPAAYYLHQGRNRWIYLGGTVDRAQGTVTVAVKHFSRFAVMADAALPAMPDVPGHWAADTIKQVVGSGFANGYPDGSFGPNLMISRAEFAKLLVDMMGLAPGGTAADRVKDAASIPGWAKGHLAKAMEAGVINGYEDGSVRPGSLITRGEMVVMMVRAARALGLQLEQGGTLTFADAGQVPEWARTELGLAVKNGLARGREDNTFGPAETATRAEAVTFLYRLLERLGIY